MKITPLPPPPFSPPVLTTVKRQKSADVIKNKIKQNTLEDVRLVEFMYLVFTCMRGERTIQVLSRSCDVSRALVNSLCLFFFVVVCWRGVGGGG